MPGRSRTPLFVKRCVAAVAPQYGDDVSRAFSICVGQAQKHGYLKAGTMQPTAKGKKLSRSKGRDAEAKDKTDAYEKLLAAARSDRATESITLGQLAACARTLLEQEAEGEGEDIASQLKGDVTGTLRVEVTFEVETVPPSTQEGVLKLLRRYKKNFQGGVGGTSHWKVEDLDVTLDGNTVVMELELNVVNYPGSKVAGDVVTQVATAVEELASVVSLPKAKHMLRNVSSDSIMAEPVTFVSLE